MTARVGFGTLLDAACAYPQATPCVDRDGPALENYGAPKVQVQSQRSIFFTGPVPRALGGYQQLYRNLLRALGPEQVDVLEYLSAPVFEELPDNAHRLAIASSAPDFVRRFATAYLTRPPTVFLLGHINLLPALAVLPRLEKHRVLLLLAGVDAWAEVSHTQRRGLRHADVVAFIARYNCAIFQSYNQRHLRPGTRLETIYLSCPPDLELVPPSPTPTSATRTILFVSRITAEEALKGLSTLLEAMTHLDPAVWRLEIVGTGPAQPRYEARAAELGIAERVVFLGKVDTETRRQCLERAELLCLPSAQEGFGIVYAEALLAGRPCVGAAAGAAPEVITEEGGAVAPYGEPVALARALQRTSDRFRAGELNPAQLRGIYERRYSWASFQQHWQDLVRGLRED